MAEDATPKRHLALAGTYNTRDLGGYPTEDGGMTRWQVFLRSDNIVFVKKGIVAHTISTGGDNPNYHQVSDDADSLDFKHLEACATITFQAARLLADGAVTPTWHEGEPDLSR